MNQSDTIIECVKEEIHLVFLVRMQRYHIIKMIPNRNFFVKVFGYSDLRYIFSVLKWGAIAQSVEQWTENPCVPGSIPGGTTLKGRPINIGTAFFNITLIQGKSICHSRKLWFNLLKSFFVLYEKWNNKKRWHKKSSKVKKCIKPCLYQSKSSTTSPNYLT